MKYERFKVERKDLDEYRSIKHWEQEGLCYWCREYVPREFATVDHIIPVKLNGVTRISNLVMSCSPCNVKRDARITQEDVNLENAQAFWYRNRYSFSREARIYRMRNFLREKA